MEAPVRWEWGGGRGRTDQREGENAGHRLLVGGVSSVPMAIN